MKEELLLVWKEPKTRRRYTIGKLTYENNKYTFTYIDPELNDSKKSGFLFYPGFSDLDKTYTSDNLFPNIETRLPNKARPDYLDILNMYGLTLESTEIDILKATKGRLLTDNFELVPAFDKNSKIEFDIAGTSHYLIDNNIKNSLRINSNVKLVRDLKNEYDRYAIKVIYDYNGDETILGYVPRYYSKDLSEILEEDVNYSAKIERLNLESEISDEDVTIGVKLIFGN